MPNFRIFRFLPGAAALALLAGCNAAPTVDSAKVGDEVKANMTEMVAAFAARDADKAVSWDAPDFVGMFHGAPNRSEERRVGKECA